MDKKKKIAMVLSVIIILSISLIILASNNQENSQTNTSDNTFQNEDINISDIVINKDEITNTAKFYKYKSGNINMEIMAVKASDGTIRTALNTCQICYDSGRGYYTQQGDYMVCKNCGNKFNLNQIEKVKGGCNPIPILAEDKTVDDNTITISKKYLDSQTKYFIKWK